MVKASALLLRHIVALSMMTRKSQVFAAIAGLCGAKSEVLNDVSTQAVTAGNP